MLLLLACQRATLQVGAIDRPPVDAAIVPGCPSLEDGRLSPCQWRRAVWAHHIWATGRTRTFIVSGNAVYNRYVEAEAMKAGLVALGVPADRVFLEPRALHTDENIAYALRIADRHGFVSIAIVSDAVQTVGTCQMVRMWSEQERTCLPAPMDYNLVRARLAMGLPEARSEPVPESEWAPLDEREQRIAEQLGRPKRGNSLWIYFTKSLLAPFGLARPPHLLPPEPLPPK